MIEHRTMRWGIYCLVVMAGLTGRVALAGYTQSENSTGQQNATSATMDTYEHILKQDPSNQTARNNEIETAIKEALAARRAGKNELALAFLLRANYWVRDSPELLTDLGIQEEAMTLYYDADSTLGKAQQLRPGDLKTIYAVARAKMELDQVQASEDAWKAYLAQRPDDASAHFGYGLLLQMLQRPDEARAQFNRSIELSPQQSESYYRLGEIARNAGEDIQAKQFYEQAIEHDPAHAGAWTGLGILAYNAKEYNQAEQDLERAVQDGPDFQTARYYHGLTLAKLGQKGQSKKELDISVKLAEAESAHKLQSKQLSVTPYKPE
ncbi:MAG TPA: tetratricopeptide repeat protein [Pseudacidobacterium sp.]|nr:tetratricopeptide repeat protein [Pseudacidobacterium sp.]